MIKYIYSIFSLLICHINSNINGHRSLVKFSVRIGHAIVSETESTWVHRTLRNYVKCLVRFFSSSSLQLTSTYFLLSVVFFHSFSDFFFLSLSSSLIPLRLFQMLSVYLLVGLIRKMPRSRTFSITCTLHAIFRLEIAMGKRGFMFVRLNCQLRFLYYFECDYGIGLR